ncbi:L-lactate MFS transporter [Vibrio sp. SCSIO 43137]|uniref:L-lactate MFS transporter n=1 Tax=Vibrio sp. SCSIO 43137 TaxID=3021011 RepID=UPI002306E68C|nr:OFA family MFS transporter [Vibrio sp. SCSIO 43137]WCE32509.1 OFA family MFS transporter [Vibrio sp. SCSIO 43137]
MKKRANQILFAACGVNLCIGVLYTWSVFKNALVNMGWSNSQASMPYTITIVVLSLSLLIAGRIQDKIGPQKVLMAGTFLAGIGMVLSSLSLTPVNLYLSFGLLTGAGIGFAYACLNPTAMKWFPAEKKGMVNGLLATAFGLAAIYLAPLTSYLITGFGLSSAFLIMGASLILIALPLSFTIISPPSDYASELHKTPDTSEPKQPESGIKSDYTWQEMIKTRQFYLLWLMYAFGASAGLMIIANITSIAATQASITEGAYLVVTLSIFNSGGRLVSGLLSDKIGGLKTLAIAMVLQAVNMLLFSQFVSSVPLMVGAALAGIGYGTLLAVFPSVMADLYGLKNYGANYGVLYTAWGIGGFIGPVVAAISVDTTGSYATAYMICAVLVTLAAVMTFRVKPLTDTSVLEEKQAACVELN